MRCCCKFFVAVSVPIFNCAELPLNKIQLVLSVFLLDRIIFVCGGALPETADIVNDDPACDIVDAETLALFFMLNWLLVPVKIVLNKLFVPVEVWTIVPLLFIVSSGDILAGSD